MSFVFADALRLASAPLIAEIKPTSPKLGHLLNGRSIASIASDYASAGVPCLSVTTGAWHNGSVDMISEIAATGLPVLRKDFIVSARHIAETKLAGAAAALLTCSVLRKTDVRRLANLALEHELTPFVEVASASEIEGLDLPQGSILAINNRNIREKEIDQGHIERSFELYDVARQCHSGLLVSASGLLHPNDVAAVRHRGFDGVLIGSALLSSPLGVVDTAKAYLEAARTNSFDAATGSRAHQSA